MSQTPRILSSTDMDINEAKWITLKKIKYSDAAGSERQWESAERRTRKESGIDAVAIFAVISSKTNAFPKSTVIIEQYRPPIGKFVVEMPAGLIDANESPESAAIRELEEETGYKADEGGVVESSPVIVSDPGMTNANMKLVFLSVSLPDALETPDQKLEEGEFITKRVVAIKDLLDELKAYESKGLIVDARLYHLAAGYAMAKQFA